MKSYKKYYKGSSDTVYYDCIFKRERTGWLKTVTYVYVNNVGWRKAKGVEWADCWREMKLFVTEITEQEAFLELL